MRTLLLATTLTVSLTPSALAGFTDIAASAGIDNGALAQGCAWGDFDGDGYPDLFATNNYAIIVGSRAKLYRNNAGASFTDRAATVGVDDQGPSFGAAWADYDNDADVDLYLVRGAFPPFITGDHYLYRDDGPATGWNRQTTAASAKTGRSVAWADYDNDGFVDVFITDGPDPITGNVRPSLLRNRGDGTFVDVTTTVGIADTRNGNGVAWGDYDSDGWPDLFLVNYGVPELGVHDPNVLYRNVSGSFVDVTSTMQVRGDEDGQQRGCFGAAWADYDNDSDLDLYVTCGFDSLGSVGTGFGSTNLMYRNDGTSFTDVSLPTLTADPEGSFSCAWGDYDNDGLIDLYVANGIAVTPAVTPANRLFHNVKTGPLPNYFVDEGAAQGVDSDLFSQACAWADYDRDGDLDLYVVETTAADQLFRNDGPTGNWLELRLSGSRSNRSAIGAKVFAMSGGVRQMRVVSGGSGYLSQDDLVVHFGLGASADTDIEIHWPGPDFCIQRLGTVLANQILDVTETCSAPVYVLRNIYTAPPMAAMFPLPQYQPLPAAPPFLDAVLGGPEPLLLYQVEVAGNSLRLVKSPAVDIALSW